MEDQTLVAQANSEGHWEFQVAAWTLGGQVESRTIIVDVMPKCNQNNQEIDPVDGDVLELTYERDDGVQTIYDDYEMQDIFKHLHIYNCRAESFEIYHQNGSAISEDDELYWRLGLADRTDNTVSFDTHIYSHNPF